MTKATTKKIVTALLASMTGFSGAVIGASVLAYDACFPRYERPDYAVTAGNYYYERVRAHLPRKEFTFPSRSATLKGYYYPTATARGLVVVAHGYHAGADDYVPLIEYFVQNGYNVFSYDVTGTYDSEGEGNVGWCQSLVDLDYALTFIQKTAPYSGQKLYLVGHSWGGYAVSSVLSLHKEVRACACIAPMNNGSTIMLEKGEQYVGKAAKAPAPIINAYQKLLFKDYTKYSGVLGINSVDIPVLIAQGVNDNVITYNGQSIMAHKDELTNPNVRYYVGKGLQGGHDSVWHSMESIVYQNEVESERRLLEMQKGGKLSYEQEAEFTSTLDHDLYSAVNVELMQQILEMFNSAN